MLFFFLLRLQALFLLFMLLQRWHWVREAVAWCSGVGQSWEEESHQGPLFPRRGLSLGPGDAGDASGTTFGVPCSEEAGCPGIPGRPGSSRGLGRSQRVSAAGTLGRPCPRLPVGQVRPPAARRPPGQPRGLAGARAAPSTPAPAAGRGAQPAAGLAAAASAVPPSARPGGDNGRPAGPCPGGGRLR